MAFARKHPTAADGTFSGAGVIAWEEAHSVVDATSGGIPYFSSTTTEGSSALLTAGAIVLGGGAATAPLTSAKMSESATAGGGLILAAGTAVGAGVAAMSMTRTNNNAAVDTGVLLTYIDTISASGFFAFKILGGAAGTTNLLTVTKVGNISTAGGYEGVTASLSSYISSPAHYSEVNGALGYLAGATSDTNLSRISAGLWGVGTGSAGSTAGSLSLTNSTHAGYSQLTEMTAPAGAANSARIFAQDNGGGKTQLMVIFGSGIAQQIAIEP